MDQNVNGNEWGRRWVATTLAPTIGVNDNSSGNPNDKLQRRQWTSTMVTTLTAYAS